MDSLCLLYTSYPPIEIEKPDRRYIAPLLHILASKQSEMSAIYTYAYDSFVLKAKFPELSEVTSRIGEVEMHHFQILGELVTLLGGDPRCMAMDRGRLIPWNGTMASYQRNVKMMLMQNMKSEQEAVNIYTAQSMRIKDAKLSAILARLAEDEQVHYQIFMDFYARYSKQEK